MSDTTISRRHALKLIVASVPCFVGGCTALNFFASREGASSRAATAACHVTPDNPLGPYYIADAPFRSTLYPNGTAGIPLRVSGVVTGPNCDVPLENAVVDVWQADDNGAYDFSDQFIGRARISTDADGNYSFDTVVPGYYATRPRHIHFYVSHPNAQELVTQLYFESDERSSGITPALVLPLEEDESGTLSTTFDIVLAEI